MINTRYETNLIGVTSNGGITRNVAAIMNYVSRNDMNLRFVADLNTPSIVYRNPKWDHLEYTNPERYYSYTKWELNGRVTGMDLTAEETDILDSILNFDYMDDGVTDWELEYV